jgi:hypothetical protein
LKPFEPKQPMKLGGDQLFLLVAATAVVWWALGRLDLGVAWLTVEAPRQAVAGRLLPMHIHIAGLQEPSQLCADLHWAKVRDVSNGFLASGGATPVGRQGGSFDFEIRVRATNDLRFVHGIIYLSPDGDWNNHTFAATTDLIPVTDDSDGKATRLVRLPVRPLEAYARDNVRRTTIPRLMTGLLLLVSSVIAWMICGSIAREPERSKLTLRRWQVLASALTLACIWECLGLENWVWMHVRVLARAGDVYSSRTVFQKAIISVTIAATLVGLGLLWRKRRAHQFVLVSFGLYLAISAVNLISLHAIDKYAGLSWLGITVVEALKFVCAATTLYGVWRARR